ncbi:hypothetical protein [Sphingobium aquiterrae]|uniref:hypothetical protein n=1 Tax=Sphingobium aquiterrae TaxID=2038656 RepID=UPI003016FFDD
MLAGCKRLGGNGTEQEGIDILARDDQQPDKLNLFECKGWKDFSPTRLTEAVDTFLKGAWSKSANRFTIILAQKDTGIALSRRWEKERRRLKEHGIDGELWTAEDLTLKVQFHPDIVSKFFPYYNIEYYANTLMKSENFYQLVSKSLFDPDKRVARLAREFLQSDGDRTGSSTFVIDGTYRRIDQIGNGWHFKGPWLGLSAILPDQRFTHASAALTFNRPDMQGVTLTVDHKWLLTRFLFREGAPLTGQNRGFIVGATPHSDNQYLDLPHCRLSLQRDGAEEIAQVADRLTDAMRISLRALEADWSAVDFPFVARGGRKVALAAISVDAWREIGRFAEEHDVSKGATPWHMFDGNREMLKPYHETANEDFDAGYHGVIRAAQISGLSHEREVILLWQPNSLLPNQTFSSRGWWSCEFTLQWLGEILLPEVRRHVHERDSIGRGRRIFHSKQPDPVAAHLDSVFAVRDLRQRPLFRDGHWLAGIVESATALQSFFCDATTPEPYIRQGEMENLYRSVAIIAQSNRGYVGYAGSKLGLHRNPRDHMDLIRMIHEYISEGCVVPNSAVADNVFRAMLEMLDDTDAWLRDTERATVRAHIAPFARLRDDAILVHRHTKWD